MADNDKKTYYESAVTKEVSTTSFQTTTSSGGGGASGGGSGGKLEQAMNLLKKDLDSAEKQWEGGDQFMSFLQRNDITFGQLIDIFDPSEDENKWCQEYNSTAELPKLIQLRRRLAFLKASRKEFHEEYDQDITDCDFLRTLEVPFKDPRYIIEFSLHEMKAS